MRAVVWIEEVRAIAAEEAQGLLASALQRVMRDGELRLGPTSLGRAARFVVDHALRG